MVALSCAVPPVTRLSTFAASLENVSTLFRIPPSTENMTLERDGLLALAWGAGFTGGDEEEGKALVAAGAGVAGDGNEDGGPATPTRALKTEGNSSASGGAA